MGIVGAPITSSEVVQRAQFWIGNPPPNGYSQSGDWKDSNGKQYRTDCSGYVSMAWHLPSSPNTTALLSPLWTTPVDKSKMAAGDILCAPAGNGHSSGHAVIFVRWVNTKQDTYAGMEFGFGAAPITRNIPYPYDANDSRHFTPRRYNKLVPTNVSGDNGSTPVTLPPISLGGSKAISTTTGSAIFATAGFAVAGIIAIVIILTMLKF